MDGWGRCVEYVIKFINFTTDAILHERAVHFVTGSTAAARLGHEVGESENVLNSWIMDIGLCNIVCVFIFHILNSDSI